MRRMFIIKVFYSILSRVGKKERCAIIKLVVKSIKSKVYKVDDFNDFINF